MIGDLIVDKMLPEISVFQTLLAFVLSCWWWWGVRDGGRWM